MRIPRALAVGASRLGLLAALCGCAPGEPVSPAARSAIGFQAAGVGYRSAPASLEGGAPGTLVLSGRGLDSPVRVSLQIPHASSGGQGGPQGAIGQDLPVSGGEIEIPESRILKVSRGTFTLQSIQGGLCRGNFEVRARETGGVEQEVRGFFDAAWLEPGEVLPEGPGEGG